MADLERVSTGRRALHAGTALGPPKPAHPPIEPPEGPDLEVTLDDDPVDGGRLEQVTSTAPVSTSPASDYPIEAGIPHPRWIPEPSEHGFGARRVHLAESRAVVALLGTLAVAAFLLGMTVFYPVSPLGH